MPEDDQALVLDESTLKGVAGLGIEIERHYGKPQDIEFAVADHHISIVQSRPITTPLSDDGPSATSRPTARCW